MSCYLLPVDMTDVEGSESETFKERLSHLQFQYPDLVPFLHGAFFTSIDMWLSIFSFTEIYNELIFQCLHWHCGIFASIGERYDIC